MSLPRMSFEFTGIEYDTSRKLGATQTFTTAIKTDKKDVRKVYMPVPYNMAFELNIMTLLNDDALQIVEQIFHIFNQIIQLNNRFSRIYRGKERYTNNFRFCIFC